MGSFSAVHWLMVVIVILLLFGPGRLASVGKGLGEGIRSFKKGITEDPPEEEKPEASKQLADKSVTAEGQTRS